MRPTTESRSPFRNNSGAAKSSAGMTLMAMGEYQDRDDCYMPSILY
jgi:hypothetical protein